MAYKAPTLTELIARTRNDIVQYTQQRTLVSDGVAFAIAGQSHGNHEHLDYLSRQIVPHLADEAYLLKYCHFWGVWRKEPSHATGKMTLTVTDATQITAGTQWQRSDGELFALNESVIVDDAGSVSVTVTALNAGATGNTSQGEKMMLVSPVLNVTPDAICAGIGGGADIESIDSLRARLQFRVQYPPSGGTKFDYVRWALECAGVTRAWCIPAEIGQNWVKVMFVCDERTDIFPSEADIALVDDYISGHKNPFTNQVEGKPPCTELIVQSPKARPLNPVIQLLPDSVENREAVQYALTKLLQKSPVGGSVLLSQFRAAISNVTDIVDHHVYQPASDVYVNDDELIVLGVITWR